MTAVVLLVTRNVTKNNDGPVFGTGQITEFVCPRPFVCARVVLYAATTDDRIIRARRKLTMKNWRRNVKNLSCATGSS